MALLVESASDPNGVAPSSVTFKLAGSDEASSESSSIGAPSDGDEDSASDDEAQSTLSLDDLESSLPSSKKGLSTFYGGRSKSYGNLSEVTSVGDIEKPDNPFNKRRRNLLAHKLSSWSNSASSSPSKRRMVSSFYGHRNPISMPLLPVHEQDDIDDEDEDEDDDMEGDAGRKNVRLGLGGGSRFCI